MSSYIDVPEQLCYIPCNFCNIVLAVSVPCSNLFDMVTVRCGHCSNLWSVNMAAAAFQLQQLQEKLSSILETKPQEMATLGSLRSAPIFLTDSAPNYAASERKIDFGSSSKCNNKMAMSLPPISTSTEQRIVNRPPEKRQRVPSAYNQFIKEEIQRIKANNPEISHREAFSTAAKNWAHFPHIHFGLMLESNNQPKRGF